MVVVDKYEFKNLHAIVEIFFAILVGSETGIKEETYRLGAQ